MERGSRNNQFGAVLVMNEMFDWMNIYAGKYLNWYHKTSYSSSLLEDFAGRKHGLVKDSEQNEELIDKSRPRTKWAFRRKSERSEKRLGE